MENQQATQSFRSPVVDLIWSHGTLCEEVYSLLLEENRILRGAGELEKSGVLDRKRMLLNALDTSLQQMRQAARSIAVAKTPVLKTVATKAQRVLLKAMLLDKENEQLLLKHALSSSSGEMQIIPKPTAKQVKKRYESQN